MSSQGLGERKLILITTGHKPVFMQNCFDWIAHVSSAARPHLGHMLLFSGMALVGVYVALSKPLTAAIPVFLLAWLRFAIAAVAMLPWTLGGREEAPVGRAQWHRLFLQSLFGNFLFSICMLYGISMTSAASAGVILSTLPAVVALFSWLFLRERLSARGWWAVGLAVGGVALLSLARTDGGLAGGSAVGNLLVLGCVGCEAVYVILGKRLTATLSPMRISALINLFGLLLMTPFGLWQAASFDFDSVTGATWALLVFYALAASMVSTWLWLSGLRHVPASRSGVFTIAMPLAAAAVGVVWLGEHFSGAHALAFLLASSGIVLMTRTDRRGR
jgi:drug/metabolite transporter (DMT)-like permease